jgi:predicted PurR-regulated permease PerM
MNSKMLWIALSLVLLALAFYALSPILTPFVVAALLAYLGDPLVRRLMAYHMPRSLAVSVVFIGIFLLVIGLLLILVPSIEKQIERLLAKLPEYLRWIQQHVIPQINAWLPDNLLALDAESIRQTLQEHWRNAGGLLANVSKSLTQSGLAILAWLANLILIPILTFYLLRDWESLVGNIQGLLPRSILPTWNLLSAQVDEVLGAFLRGQLLVMLALGIIYTTGLWLVGLDFALLIGLLAGIVSFVPYLGLIVGILIAGVAAVLQFQGVDQLPAVAAVFIVGQLLEGMVLTPRLVGGRIGLHPVAVIFAIMAGGQLYGFFGVLLALPVAAVVMVLLRYVLKLYRESDLYTG